MSDPVNPPTSLINQIIETNNHKQQPQDKFDGKAKSVTQSMKRDPQGCFQLGGDGVLRSFDGSYDRNVLDAVCFSPSQIKQLLDKMPWSQEKEDEFRGVDGRKVVDHQALFHPPDNYRPPKWTEEEKLIAKQEAEELNRKILERIAQEERDGVNVAEKYACGRVVSNYDLTPKKDE